MNKIYHLAVCAVFVCSMTIVQAATEYREFTSTEGKVIRGIIKIYNSADNTVTIERKNKKVFTVPITLFSEADQAYISRWKNLEGIRRTSKFKVSCDRRVVKDWREELRGKVFDGRTVQANQVVGKADFQEVGYEISLENGNGYPVENLYLEYCIYYKQEMGSDKYAEEGVYCGSTDIGEISKRKTKTIKTDTVVIFEFEKNTDLAGSFRLSSKVSGIALRLYVREGDKKILLREEARPSSVTNSRRWATSSSNVGANIEEDDEGEE